MVCRRSASRGQRRRGMIAVFTALSFTLLLVAAALSLDAGNMMAEKRHAQETADAAALAAAADLFQHWPLTGHGGTDPDGTASASAFATAAANGYANDGTTTSVTVNIPPKSGPFANNTQGYVEVLVTYHQKPGPNPFYKYSGPTSTSTGGSASVGLGSKTIPISARAVARGQWVPANPEIIVFDLTAPGSLLVTNNLGSVNVTGGPVIVNSSDPAAATNTTPANFTAPSYRITGGALGNFTGPKSFGVRPSPDPLWYLPVPTSNVSGSPLTVQSTTRVNYSDSNPPPNPLPEGIYQGGISVTGGASLTLQPNGTFVMQGGGFSFDSYGNLTGYDPITRNGVMIYNQPSASDTGAGILISNDRGPSTDPFDLFGDDGPPGTVTLAPLTNGPYQGITLFQQQSGTNPISIFGGGGLSISGTVYAANTSVTVRTESYNGHNDVAGSQFMSRYLSFAGLSTYNLSQVPKPAMQRLYGLVE